MVAYRLQCHIFCKFDSPPDRSCCTPRVREPPYHFREADISGLIQSRWLARARKRIIITLPDCAITCGIVMTREVPTKPFDVHLRLWSLMKRSSTGQSS